MELEFLEQNISDPAVIIPAILKEHKQLFDSVAYKQFNPKNHKVFDRSARPDKKVFKPTGNLDGLDENGNPKLELVPALEYVNRIAIAIQRLIVQRSAAFLAGGPVTLTAAPADQVEEDLLQAIKDIWKDTKMQYRNSLIARRMMAERECAEVWYSRKDADNRVEMRSKVYSPSDGYKLIPVWGESDDLIAFGIQWENVATGKRYLNLYTAKELRKHLQDGSGWLLIDQPVSLPYGKLPVIYFSQPESEWDAVQEKIERLETLVSNFGDTNDYNGSPILFAEGQIQGFAAKGDAGKMIQGDAGAKLSYVTWEHAPEAIKLEMDKLENFIYTVTQTPNISFNEMKSLGDISGAAFDRLFMDPHLKASLRHTGDFGECIQRRINFLIAAAISIDKSLEKGRRLDITPQFSLFRIDDTSERIDTAQKANGGKPVMSQRRSIEYVGLAHDADKELDEIKADQPEPVLPVIRPIAKEAPAA